MPNEPFFLVVGPDGAIDGIIQQVMSSLPLEELQRQEAIWREDAVLKQKAREHSERTQR